MVRRAADALARTDSSDGAVRAARAARRLIPPARPAVSGPRPSDRLARLIAEARQDQPSAVRELGLGAVAVWQSLRSRRPGHGDRAVTATILFTDLVGFSTWALDVGDEKVLDLLAQVNTVTESVVSARGGRIVKHLGDGAMAVFVDGTQAIEAAYEAICAVSAVTVDGHRPQLRAGLHTGTPRAVGDDYLGVDVNIAARVAAAAGPGELLVSDATLAVADPERYHRRRRRFRAKGVPRELEVFAVVPRYEN
ncbi:adenylate/guanylate cyclase domain-containing protein [Gordonia sp. CPCC 206044]